MANIVVTDKAVVSEPATQKTQNDTRPVSAQPIPEPEDGNDTVPITPKDNTQRRQETGTKPTQTKTFSFWSIPEDRGTRKYSKIPLEESKSFTATTTKIAYIDTNEDGFSEPFEKGSDGVLVPIRPRQVIHYNGQDYTKMDDGSLKPMIA